MHHAAGIHRFGAAVDVRHAGRLTRRVAADPHVPLAAALAIPTLILHAIASHGELPGAIALSAASVALQVLLAVVIPRLPSSMSHHVWAILRLVLALAFVALVDRITGDSSFRPAVILYIPVVVVAAAIGLPEAVAIASIAVCLYLAPVVADASHADVTAQRGIMLAATAITLAVGTRRTVHQLESALQRLRAAISLQTKRSRQLAGVEAVGAVLAADGSNRAALQKVIDLLVEQFDHSNVSIYLGSGNVLRLGAQRGYTELIDEFDGTSGIVGRVMRTRQPAFVPDTRGDPDFVAMVPGTGMGARICAPLLVGGELLGILNVEAIAAGSLDRSDYDAVLLVADRLGSALAVARQREDIAERAELFRRLASYSATINSTLVPSELYPAIVRSASRVIPADKVILVVLDRQTGRYVVRGIEGGPPSMIGGEIQPGEGMSGRAIRDRTLVVSDHFEKARLPAAVREIEIGEVMATVAVPLIRDEVVLGALTLARDGVDRPFTAPEQEVLAILGNHAAMAVSNVFLYSEVTESSLRDPLTGLFNRRYLDASLERISAARQRQSASQRQPVSVIMFDVDNFGEFNKHHGHRVGDSVLRTFGGILRGRMRKGDLVARYGGDEFLVVVEGADRAAAVSLAEQVARELRAVVMTGADGKLIGATVSAGVAEVDADAVSVGSGLEAADVGLAMAKGAGRDKVVAA